MREILFLAKTKKDKVWIEGDLRQDKNLEEFYICGYDYYADDDGFLERKSFDYIVIPNTICQYTCFHDKNERKIFENDIVRYKDYIGIVKYGKHGKHYGFYIEWQNDASVRKDIIFWSDKITVIGNIFDDSSLLENAQRRK